MIVSCHVGVRNWNWVLSKSCKCLWLFNHLSGPKVLFLKDSRNTISGLNYSKVRRTRITEVWLFGEHQIGLSLSTQQKGLSLFPGTSHTERGSWQWHLSVSGIALVSLCFTWKPEEPSYKKLSLFCGVLNSFSDPERLMHLLTLFCNDDLIISQWIWKSYSKKKWEVYSKYQQNVWASFVGGGWDQTQTLLRKCDNGYPSYAVSGRTSGEKFLWRPWLQSTTVVQAASVHFLHACKSVSRKLLNS